MSSAGARRLVVGLDEPEVRTPASLAFFVSSMARTWLDTMTQHRGTRDQFVQAMTEWVEAIEVCAAWHRCRLSAESAADGQVLANGSERRDAGLRTSTAGSVHKVERGLETGAAADRLGVDARTIRRLLDRGDLTGTKVGARVWLVDPQSVNDYLQRTRT